MKFNQTQEILFYHPVWQVEVSEIDNQSIKDYALDLRSKSDGTVISNRGGWHSKEIEQPLPDSLNTLLQFTQDYVNNESSKITGMNDLFIGNWWININGPGDYNEVHDHQNAMLSAVYYVDVPAENTGDLELHRNDTAEFFLKGYRNTNLFTSTCQLLKPATGRMYIIPAWTKHSVRRNDSDTERISIAINLVSKYNQ